MTKKEKQRRRFWVVSPNVKNDNRTVSQWRQASVVCEAAFMGYKPDSQKAKEIGYKFANVVRPRDVLLIARRYQNKVEVVGLGVVVGKFKRRLKGFRRPAKFGSLRKLSPFKPLSAAPPKLPIMDVLRHTTALRELHPQRNSTHRLICEWMERSIAGQASAKSRAASHSRMTDTKLANMPHENELEYEVRTRAKVKLARKTEAELMARYRKWLEDQDRKLVTSQYGRLRCDAYEKERGNLIEAKCSVEREYIRMAVGQLLHYAYLGRKRLGKPKMAILLPERPDPESIEWLTEIKINVVWREENVFLDNANGQFS